MQAPTSPHTTDQTTPATDKNFDAAVAALAAEIIGVSAGSRGHPVGVDPHLSW